MKNQYDFKIYEGKVFVIVDDKNFGPESLETLKTLVLEDFKNPKILGWDSGLYLANEEYMKDVTIFNTTPVYCDLGCMIKATFSDPGDASREKVKWTNNVEVVFATKPPVSGI